MKIKEGMVIHCDTEEKANKLMRELDKLGYSFKKEDIKRCNHWECYRERTVYKICKYKDVVYGNIQSEFYETGKVKSFDELEEEAEEYKQRLLQEQKEKDEFKPTKTYLMEHKDEYVVEVRNGSNIMFTDKWKDEIWGNTNEDLTNKFSKGCDITKIYKITPVWEREEAKEMTLAEIEEVLGYNIKLKEE